MFDLFGNGTIAPPVNWQPDASTRGTTDVLSTCLLTLGLCLWSALHLNIPQHGKSSQQKWHKCGWLVLGLLAPEMVAFAAWVQLRAAKMLDNHMKQLLGEAPSTSLRDKFWRLRAEWNGRFKSTSGRDVEQENHTEQHDGLQTGEENMRPLHLNVAGGDQPPGTASHETRPRAEDGSEASHDSVTMDPKLNSSKSSFAARYRLVDQDRDNERCVLCRSETRHQITIDEADTELREEYGRPSHRQPGSAEPTTLPDGKRSLKKRRHPWTMTHSFYALMGGFAFDTSGAEPNFLPNHRSRLCIRVSGLTYIAEKAPGLIPSISEKQIKDRSKADNLAKLIVCLQALWFCVQCMTRVTQRKAISLLELNTFAHAFCALLIYALWWHKPKDVEEPTLLQGEKEWEMCAFLCMNCITKPNSNVEKEVISGIAFGESEPDGAYPPMIMVWHNAAATKPASASGRIIYPETDSSPSEEDPYRRNLPGEGPAVVLKHGEFVYGFQCKHRKQNQVSRRSHETLTIEPPHLRRLELYWNATKSFNIGHNNFIDRGAVCDSMHHWPLPIILDESKLLRSYHLGYMSRNGNPMLLGLILSGLLYGGLHLLAWKMPFASRAECILWRFSGIFIISTGLGFTGLKGFFKAYNAYIVYRSARIHFDLTDNLSLTKLLFKIFANFFIITLCLGYLLARTFLVVECFLQLSRLPPSAYETPEWSVYFPHIT